MKHYTLFISDLHLSSATPATTAIFLEFLSSSLVQNADAFYILGDLFQFWIGDDDRSPYNQQVQMALKQAGLKTPIYLMAGNRDFLLGNTYAKESSCTLIPDPLVINLYNKKTILTHGDILCTKDIKYGVFRKIIRFPYATKIFLTLPLKLRLWLATKIQKYTIKCKAAKNPEMLVVEPNEVKKLLLEFNANQIIHGHTHLVEIKAHRIALGEWDKKSSILIYYDDHSFEL